MDLLLGPFATPGMWTSVCLVLSFECARGQDSRSSFLAQVYIVSIPVLLLLGDASADGSFVGLSLIIVTFPLTNMGLIIGPKMVKVYEDGKPRRSTLGGPRGARDHVRVTGLGEDPSNRPSIEDTTATTTMTPTLPGVHHQTVVME